MPNESASPRPRHVRLLMTFGGLLVAAGLFMLMLRYDGPIIRAQQGAMSSRISATLQQVIDGFRNFGQVINIIVFILFAAAYDARRKAVIVAIVAAQIISGTIYNAGKYTIWRERPYVVYDASHKGLVERINSSDSKDAKLVHENDIDAGLDPRTAPFAWRPINKERDAQSFPSGHSAAACALAGVLTNFYRRLRISIWILALGCAVSRVVEAMHWPSDCIAGAAIGWTSAQAALAMANRFCKPRSEKIATTL